MNSLNAFPWYGGKTAHLDFIIPFVNNTPHVHYVEPFGGSAAVLLNKAPSPVETYNDLYSEVVNFFRVLREDRDNLIRLLDLTPYSREEFALACSVDQSESPLERARKFYIRARQVRTGLATQASSGRWSYTKNDSRKGKSLSVSRWLTGVESLHNVCMRLKDVQIENLDAKDVIERYDDSNVLFYLDPPYLLDVRSGCKGYKHEMTEDEHLNLLGMIRSIKGKALLSGYESELYCKELKGWRVLKDDLKKSPNTRKGDGTADLRQEVIWANYQPCVSQVFEV